MNSISIGIGWPFSIIIAYAVHLWALTQQHALLAEMAIWYVWIVGGLFAAAIFIVIALLLFLLFVVIVSILDIRRNVNERFKRGM